MVAGNIVLAIGGLNGFVSTEVQNSTFVLRIKFSAKNPAHRQYAVRCRQVRRAEQIKITEEKYFYFFCQRTIKQFSLHTFSTFVFFLTHKPILKTKELNFRNVTITTVCLINYTSFLSCNSSKLKSR